MTQLPKPLVKAEKAYRNPAFLNSASARSLRILSEFLEPMNRFRAQGIKDTIVFFGSARIKSRKDAKADYNNLRAKYNHKKKLTLDQERILKVASTALGTLDELMEVLTLLQTNKVRKRITVVLYGPEYWRKIINFDRMMDFGVVHPRDFSLFTYADSPEEAHQYLKLSISGRIVRTRRSKRRQCNQLRVVSLPRPLYL